MITVYIELFLNTFIGELLRIGSNIYKQWTKLVPVSYSIAITSISFKFYFLELVNVIALDKCNPADNVIPPL